MQNLQEIIKEVRNQKEFYSNQKLSLKKEIAELPKGTIQKKPIKNNIYYYLQYRKRGKITHEYLGKKVEPELIKKINKRKRLEAKLKPINEQLKILKKFKF